MPDQDWGSADGTARGAASGRTTGGDRERVTGADAPNVVPFPRDWYGSVDDLVPIDLEPPQAGPNAAAAFWDGDAGIAEGAGIVEEDAEPSDRRLGHGDAGVTVGSDRIRSMPRSQHQDAHPRRRGVWKPALAALLAVILGGVAAVLITQGGRPHAAGVAGRQRQPDTVKMRTETVTTPVTVTATAPTRPRRHRHRVKSASPLPRKSIVVRSATSPSPSTSSSPSVADSSRSPAADLPKSKTGAKSESIGVSKSASSATGCAQSPDSGCLP
jgi:hypothetical protein